MIVDAIAILILVVCFVAGVVLIPLGLPGLWVILVGLLGYGWLTDFASVSTTMILVALGLAFVGEILEAWIGYRMTRRYGGSKRAGWGALAGGIVGAVLGLPVPLLGSVLGAFVGSFIGAALFEYTYSRGTGTAMGAGWGAVLGRAAAAGLKMGFGFVIGLMGLYAVLQ